MPNGGCNRQATGAGVPTGVGEAGPTPGKGTGTVLASYVNIVGDRLGFTVPTYAVGEMVIIYYRQVLLPLGIAWLHERWYRFLLIGCLHLSLGCDTWFTS